MTGFSAAVLRAWERRHGLLEPERPGGSHRLYTELDLQVIRRVAQLLAEGRSISEIAALGREALLSERRDESAWAPEPPGGLPGLSELRRALVDAAIGIDEAWLRSSLDDLFSRFDARTAVTLAIVPALREIGQQWYDGTVSVAGEHMVSTNLRFRLYRLLEQHRAGHRPVVLCACLPGEQHELGVLTVALFLAASGHRILYLGPNVPFADLARTVVAREISAVCLSVTRTDVLDDCRDELIGLAKNLSVRVQFHVGGLGADTGMAGLLEAGVRVWRGPGAIDGLSDALADPGLVADVPLARPETP